MNYQKITFLILFTLIFGVGIFGYANKTQAATFADCPTSYGTLVCGEGEQYCGACVTSISDNKSPDWTLNCGTCTWSCPAPSVSCGGTCGPAYTDENPTCVAKKVKTNQCGTCTTTCSTPTDTYCSTSTSCVEPTVCGAGATWNGCACVANPYLFASPSTPQSADMNISGNATIGGWTLTNFLYGASGSSSETIVIGDVEDIIEIGGQIKIKEGDPDDGKVLTSDANGLASWQDPTTISVGDSLWTQSVTNIYYSAGNVGIGTNNPNSLLNIRSSGNKNDLTIKTSDNSASQGIAFQNSGDGYTWNIFRQNFNNNHANLVFAGGLNANIDLLDPILTLEDSTGHKGKNATFSGGTTSNWADVTNAVTAGYIHSTKTGGANNENSIAGNLEIDGNLTIKSEGYSAGKVLISDGNGLASWQNPNTIVSGNFIRKDINDQFTSLYQSYNSGAPFDIGSTGVDYPGNSGWGNPNTFNSNMLISGFNTATIGFHDSGSSIGVLGFNAKQFFFDGSQSWGPLELGINTRSPGYPLDIQDNDNTSILNIDNTGIGLWTGTRLARDGEEKWFIGMPDYSDKFLIKKYGSNNNLTIYNNNVGIGIDSPVYKLEVDGAIKANAIYTNFLYGASGSLSETIVIGDAGDIIEIGGQIKIKEGDPGDGKVLTSNTDGLASWKTLADISGGDSLWTQSVPNIYYSAGNVGIGTNNPNSLLNIRSSGNKNDLTIQTSNNLASQGIAFQNSGGGYTWNIFRQDSGSSYADLVFASGLDSNINNLTTRLTINRYGNATFSGEINGQWLHINGNGGNSIAGSLEIGVNGATGGIGDKTIKINGDGEVTGDWQVGSISVNTADLAEEFVTSREIETGTVMVMGDFDLGYKSAKPSERAYDTSVIGVVSDNPAVVMGKLDVENKAVIALTGVVHVKVNNTNGKIKRGDLLTTSSITGQAMRATDPKVGTVIGKAMEDFNSQSGQIMALINLQ